MCTAMLGNSGPLVCTRTDDHDRGHVFVSSSLGDKHDQADSNARQDNDR